jgi:two-component sensor histidine kinase
MSEENKLSRTEYWQRTRRIQMTSLRAVGLALLILIVVLEGLVIGPIRRTLRDRDVQESTVRAELILSRVNEFLHQSEDLVLQIPSRTRIREELVSYLEGKSTREYLVRFSEPKLADAVDASDAIIAVYRYGPGREPLFGVYIEPEDLPSVNFGDDMHILPDIGTVSGIPVIFFTTPIRHTGFGLAGYDLVAISLEPLEQWISNEHQVDENFSILFLPPGSGSLADTVFPSMLGDETKRELDAITPSSIPHRYISEKHIWTYELKDDWSLVIVRDGHWVHKRTRREIGTLGFAVLIAGGLTIVMILWFMNLFSRRTLVETGELERIVAEQTEDLKLMIREVHHRVKNDIYLTNMMLELKAMEADDPKVSEIIADATGSLRLMAELYDLLHTGESADRIPVKSLVDKIADRIRRQSAGRSLEIRLNVSDEVISRKSSRPLAIIVNELLTNAVKYTRDSRAMLEIHLSVLVYPEGGIEMTVSDNGPGFPPDVLDGKYGFGLTMAQSMTSRLNGEMILENSPGAAVHLKWKDPFPGT